MTQNERRKILLIDDDPSLLTTLADFLAFEGYDVETAESAEAGLAVLDGVDPDLIILDMSMPGMGGVGFLREVTNVTGRPSHPVLVLTARANMAEFFANVEVDGFVAKPCDPQDLLMEVSRIIFLRSGEDEATGTDSSSVQVLVGEADVVEASAVIAALQARGFDVTIIGTGPAVLEAAIVGRPGVIVLRAVLEGLNGDRVAEMLKTMPNTKHIPVLIYGVSDIPAGRSSVADALLEGLDADAICAAVQRLI
jgi:DNA-binding response OmpR family regulator